MNRGVLRGITADLTAARCWETATRRRATKRDMFPPAVSSVCRSGVKCSADYQWSRALPLRRDLSCCSEFTLVFQVKNQTFTWMGQSGLTLPAFIAGDCAKKKNLSWVSCCFLIRKLFSGKEVYVLIKVEVRPQFRMHFQWTMEVNWIHFYILNLYVRIKVCLIWLKQNISLANACKTKQKINTEEVTYSLLLRQGSLIRLAYIECLYK